MIGFRVLVQRFKRLVQHFKHLGDKNAILMSLRWLALLVVLILSFFNPFNVGVIIPMSILFPAIVVYNLTIASLGRLFAWPRRPLNLLALDTLIALGAIYLTGGFHSPFFILLYFIVAEAAFYLNLLQTIAISLIFQVLYITICFLNPSSQEFAYVSYSVSIKSAVLPLIGVLSAFLLEQLRREHQETERERLLASRLSALNNLFQELSVDLELQQILQLIVSHACTLLEAESALISLIEGVDNNLKLVAIHGMDESVLRNVHWTLDDQLVKEMLEAGQPIVCPSSFPIPKQYCPLQMLINHEGIVCAASTPLLINGQTIGFLDVGHRQPREYSPEDLTFLAALGQEAAIAVRNARLFQTERQHVEQLEAMEEIQSSFFSSISHELRTPLTILRASLALLRELGDEAPPEKRQELFDTIEHHSQRLEALISDLLEVVQLEARQLRLSKLPTDLRKIIQRAVSEFVPLMAERKQTVHLEMRPELPTISIDRRRIEQVLNNLLSNAHKFAPSGGEIRISVEKLEAAIEVSVWNNGPEIPMHERQRIFEKFQTLPSSGGSAGVGLGLYIARHLVNLHGGSIRVESPPGGGTRFAFRIPK